MDDEQLNTKKVIPIVWVCRAAKCWEAMTVDSRKRLRFDDIWSPYYKFVKDRIGDDTFKGVIDFETFKESTMGVGGDLEKMVECLDIWYVWVCFKICAMRDCVMAPTMRLIPRRLAIYMCSLGIN